MKTKSLPFFILCFIFLAWAQTTKSTNSEWDNHYIFKNLAKLDWKVNVTGNYIHMRFEAHNPGWIGLGWSPVDGAMQNADMVILTKKNGEFMVEDYFSQGFVSPILDDHNDVEQISAGQDGRRTWMEFKRPLVTEDRLDRPIEKGRMRLIWGLGRTIDSLEIHSEKGHDDVILWPETTGDYGAGSSFPVFPISSTPNLAVRGSPPLKPPKVPINPQQALDINNVNVPEQTVNIPMMPLNFPQMHMTFPKDYVASAASLFNAYKSIPSLSPYLSFNPKSGAITVKSSRQARKTQNSMPIKKPFVNSQRLIQRPVTNIRGPLKTKEIS